MYFCDGCDRQLHHNDNLPVEVDGHTYCEQCAPAEDQSVITEVHVLTPVQRRGIMRVLNEPSRLYWDFEGIEV